MVRVICDTTIRHRYGWKPFHGNKYKRTAVDHKTITIGPHKNYRGSPEKLLDHSLYQCIVNVKGPYTKIKRCTLHGCIIIGVDDCELYLVGVKISHCLFMNCSIYVNKLNVRSGNWLIARNTTIAFSMLSAYRGERVVANFGRFLGSHDHSWILKDLGITLENIK